MVMAAGPIDCGECDSDEVGRLTRPQQFQGLRRGRRIDAAFGRVQGVVRARTDDAPFALRFGLVVPRKLGAAPMRNRIKRRLRIAIRQAADSAGIRNTVGQAKGLDIGIFPSSAVLDMEFAVLVAELDASIRALMRKLTRLPI